MTTGVSNLIDFKKIELLGYIIVHMMTNLPKSYINYSSFESNLALMNDLEIISLDDATIFFELSLWELNEL